MNLPPRGPQDAIAGSRAKAVARLIAISTALLVVLHDLIGWPVFLVAIGIAALAADLLLRRRRAGRHRTSIAEADRIDLDENRWIELNEVHGLDPIQEHPGRQSEDDRWSRLEDRDEPPGPR